MNIEEIRDYALGLGLVTEGFPFGESILVFKTGEKIFLLISLDDIPLRINVKCDPEKALELREQFSFVVPGYHMNKKHWNTIYLTDGIQSQQIQEWIKDSFLLVKKK